MKDVAFILEAPAWELGVFAGSKGIVYGPLNLTLKNGDCVDCSKGRGNILYYVGGPRLLSTIVS